MHGNNSIFVNLLSSLAEFGHWSRSGRGYHLKRVNRAGVWRFMKTLLVFTSLPTASSNCYALIKPLLFPALLQLILTTHTHTQIHTHTLSREGRLLLDNFPYYTHPPNISNFLLKHPHFPPRKRKLFLLPVTRADLLHEPLVPNLHSSGLYYTASPLPTPHSQHK